MIRAFFRRLPSGRFVAGALAAAGAALAGPGCGDPPPALADGPDVLLVTIDTLRADHLGAYGYGRPTSPNIDRLADEGALFTVAYAPMGTTSPSHATLFTSRSPLATRLIRNGLRFAEAEITLAEILRYGGYRTAAFVSSFPVSERLGFAQGFDHFDDEFRPSSSEINRPTWEGHEIGGVFSRPGDQTTDLALEWLREQNHEAPLFVWLHLFDPHFPYYPPPEHGRLFFDPDADAAQRDIDLYDGEIHHADHQVGRLVKAFSAFAAEPPLVVITSDHGEGLMDHGWRAHNRNLFDEELRVPLIFHWPGSIPAGTKVSQPARLVDVLPSVLRAVGSHARLDGFDGIDLFPHVHGEEANPGREIWLQRPLYPPGEAAAGREGPAFGVRIGEWKYIEAKEQGLRLLFDLERDPGEKANLAADHPDRVAEMSALIAAWREAEGGKVLDEDLSTDDEVQRAMDALGYAGDD